MVVPAGVAMAASHYVCGATMATICEEEPGCDRYLGCGNESSVDNKEFEIGTNEKEKQENSDNDANVADNAFNKVKPMSVNNDRQESVHLFAKPGIGSSATKEESDETSVEKLDFKRTAIHHSKDGEQSVYEIDYEEESFSSRKSYSSRISNSYIDGIFSRGRIKEIETSAGCYNIKFNLDATVLAVGLNDGNGVVLYETKGFTILEVIDRDDTVSALDWVDDPFDTLNNKKDDQSSTEKLSQLLAVGGFDGVVSIYSITPFSMSNDYVAPLYDVKVRSPVSTLSFLKDAATSYAPFPLALAIGEEDGTVKMFVTDGNQDQFKSFTRMTKIDMHDSTVLSITFGFIEDGIIMACGTKDGLIRANLLQLEKNEWKQSNLLFELQRTGAIRALRFNHDSTTLVIGGYDKKVLFVDTQLFKIVRELDADGTVNSIEYDVYNRYLLLGTKSKMLIVIDTSTMKTIKIFNTTGRVTSISWGGDSIVAMRSDYNQVSLIKLQATKSIGYSLESTRGEGSCLSWTRCGRFLARTHGNDFIIVDASKDFEEVQKYTHSHPVHNLKFCQSQNKRDYLAVVCHDGFLNVYSLRKSVGNVHIEEVASIHLELNICAVSWSGDGKIIIVGSKQMNLHFISSETFRPIRDPVRTGGRVRTIDCVSEDTFDDVGEYAAPYGIAITTGQNCSNMYDLRTFETTLEVSRSRTIRCLRYHPSLPILAIGDGGNEVMIVDLVGERKMAQFSVQGRVNSIDFSPIGDYIVVASDDCSFTIHETNTFKVVQEIPSRGFAMSVAFSGTSGQYLALCHASGETEIIKMGALLSIDYIPIGNNFLATEFPQWVYEEAIYRSPEGPSFLQRCMLYGTKDSLVCAAVVLKNSPEAVLTFDRTTGVGCFETAVELRKPNIMKLIMGTLVDGTLDTRTDGSSSILTTTMPVDGLLTLRDLILHHPPGYATDILKQMTFVKVPFTTPRKCRINDLKEQGSFSFTDPWGEEKEDQNVSIIGIKREVGMSPIDRDEVYLVPAVLPLPGLGTMDFLTGLIGNTGPDVFDNDAMGLVLDIMWNSGVRHYFLIDFILNLLFYFCWIFVVDYTAASTSNPMHNLSVSTGLVWTILFINTVFLFEQLVKMVGNRKRYLRSVWHVIDVICIGLVYSYTLQVMLSDDGDGSFFSITTAGEGSVTLAVITTLTLTMRFVSLLRGFDHTGWLVAVLAQNFMDVRGFVIVLIVILVGFTVAFRLLFANVVGDCKVALEDTNTLISDCDVDPFGSLSRSLLSTFELTIIGSYDSAVLHDSDDSVLAAIIFVIAVTVVLVVALNALIAVLGDSFSQVQEHLTANRRREKAELIVEYMSIIPRDKRRKIELNNQYFHALLASDGHGELLVNKDDWQGGLNALKRELTDMVEASGDATQRSINDLRVELSDEIESMIRNQVTSVLNDVHSEVRTLSKRRRQGTPLQNTGKNVVHAVQTVHRIGQHLTPLVPFEGIRRTLLHRGSGRNQAVNRNDDNNDESLHDDEMIYR